MPKKRPRKTTPGIGRIRFGGDGPVRKEMRSLPKTKEGVEDFVTKSFCQSYSKRKGCVAKFDRHEN